MALLNMILFLQCSFILAQNKSDDPFELAVQRYKASGISTPVSKKQHELFVKYSAASSDKEKEKPVMDIILQHSFCRL
ncbi:hypothetical protein J3R82DRAFT_1994 [Butyriboletus roseoflavus]|nr:hypothetical protein J3R82DRAFT_1994 [Butyriboletus roseoflavus]